MVATVATLATVKKLYARGFTELDRNLFIEMLFLLLPVLPVLPLNNIGML